MSKTSSIPIYPRADGNGVEVGTTENVRRPITDYRGYHHAMESIGGQLRRINVGLVVKVVAQT